MYDKTAKAAFSKRPLLFYVILFKLKKTYRNRKNWQRLDC